MSRLATASRIADFCAAVSSDPDTIRTHTSGLDDYAIDGMAPDAVIGPTSIEQLQSILTEASASGVSVIPLGGGTHLGAGNAPASYDVALSLARLNRIVEYEPADLVVSVEAGVRLVDLAGLLAAQGQFLPLDPPCRASATVGGVLAANAYGPLRHAYGIARDWLIGIRVVGADGSISKSGGRVVKNVAGYDMHKLYVGSLGSLGVIAEATFKLSPLPEMDATIAVDCRSATHAAELVLAAQDAGLALQAAELLSPPASHAVLGRSAWSILARCGGGSAAVARTLREIEVASKATGATVEARDSAAGWEAWSAAFRPGHLTLRISVMPSVTGEAIEVLDRRLAGAGAHLSATMTAGVIRANMQASHGTRPGALVDTVRDVASRYGGSVVLDAAPPLLKRDVDAFGPLRSDFPIMKRLKDQFDPKRTLSPGRFVGRL